jgi:hypothetical protein
VPTAEEADERAPDGVDVQRYEQLRRRALGGEAEGWRLGLGVLCHRGVAVWLRAWRTTAPTAVAAPAVADRVGSDELVGVLASMALAATGR